MASRRAILRGFEKTARMAGLILLAVAPLLAAGPLRAQKPPVSSVPKQITGSEIPGTELSGPDIPGPEIPGTEIQIAVSSLPAPYASPSVANAPRIIRRPDAASLQVPSGFKAELFAAGLSNPRYLATAPNGDIFLAEPDANKVTVLREGGNGKAGTIATYARGLDRPHGIAIQGDHLYVADTRRVWRYPYKPGDLRAAGPAEPVTPAGALGAAAGHWSRNIAFSPDGSRFYVSIGSMGNIGEEPEPHAAVKEFRADGSGGRLFATGLRNPVGIAFRPGTDDLYAVVNERDGLGDGLVPDYLARLTEGGFYGWPYAYIGANPQPGFAERRPDLVRRTLTPELLFRSHSAPIGLVFYSGTQLPEAYRDNAFVTLRGSWNSAHPTGYSVVRVPFRDGRPDGGYQIFATGFRTGGSDQAVVWGRPAGIAVSRDGSLLVADDTGGTIWRISWIGN